MLKHSRATNAEYGWLHCGGPGAGHFALKHNGIEYGLMQAYAEGLNIIQETNEVEVCQEQDGWIILDPV